MTMADSIFGGFDLNNSLSNFKSSTQSSMTKVKDGVLNPADVTGDNLKQGAALLKPTDTSVKGTITAYKSAAVSELDGIIGMLSGGLLNTKAITKAIRVGENGVTFDQDDLLSAVSGQMGYPINSQSSGMRKIATSINNEFKALTGVSLPGLVDSDGKTFRVNTNWRTLVGKETLRQVQQFTGINEFIDSSVQTAMYNSVMKQAASLGMSDNYKSIYDLYKVKKSADDIMVDSVRIMITQGDVVSIDAVLALLDQNGINAINAGYPDFLETLFRSFRFDKEVYPEDYDQLRDKLLSVVTRVCGPNWWQRSTQFGIALNLAIVNSASKDMITLLSKVDYLQPLLATAGMFREQSAVTTMKANFKDAPVYTKTL
jgi:hypothetical protein